MVDSNVIWMKSFNDSFQIVLTFLDASQTLRFVKRQTNNIAHIFARIVSFCASPFYWLEASSFLVKTFIVDCFQIKY